MPPGLRIGLDAHEESAPICCCKGLADAELSVRTGPPTRRWLANPPITEDRACVDEQATLQGAN